MSADPACQGLKTVRTTPSRVPPKSPPWRPHFRAKSSVLIGSPLVLVGFPSVRDRSAKGKCPFPPARTPHIAILMYNI